VDVGEGGVATVCDVSVGVALVEGEVEGIDGVVAAGGAVADAVESSISDP